MWLLIIWETVPKSRRCLLLLFFLNSPNDFNCDKACIPHRHNDSFLDSPQPCFIQIYLHPLWSSRSRQRVRHDLLEEDKCSLWQIHAPTHTSLHLVFVSLIHTHKWTHRWRLAAGDRINLSHCDGDSSWQLRCRRWWRAAAARGFTDKSLSCMCLSGSRPKD